MGDDKEDWAVERVDTTRTAHPDCLAALSAAAICADLDGVASATKNDGEGYLVVALPKHRADGAPRTFAVSMAEGSFATVDESTACPKCGWDHLMASARHAHTVAEALHTMGGAMIYAALNRGDAVRVNDQPQWLMFESAWGALFGAAQQAARALNIKADSLTTGDAASILVICAALSQHMFGGDLPLTLPGHVQHVLYGASAQSRTE